MKYLISSTKQIIVADLAFVEAHYPGDFTEIVEVETAPTRKDAVLARLAEIDKLTAKPRTTRELALGNTATKTWVTALDSEAVTLRTELAGL